ncbi:MAG: nucleotidyltransferase domain-containing protein [Bacteroidales bacterium]|nr:nucleotidyltransferase domain-containing protein [Bacteroidales bacterium]
MNIEVQEIISKFFKSWPVEKAWVFGSFSRGEETPESDVDIMVRLSKDAHLGFEYFRMILDLEQLLNRPVDMVVEGDLLEFARASAEHDKVLVYERADKRQGTVGAHS